ncbi:hypothetical protein YC2023_008332 [Brassica napus]
MANSYTVLADLRAADALTPPSMMKLSVEKLHITSLQKAYGALEDSTTVGLVGLTKANSEFKVRGLQVLVASMHLTFLGFKSTLPFRLLVPRPLCSSRLKEIVAPLFWVSLPALRRCWFRVTESMQPLGKKFMSSGSQLMRGFGVVFLC